MNTETKQEPYIILRENTWLPRQKGMDFGWGNGYVALPKGHKYYEVDYNDIPVDVHGGLTYGQMDGEMWVVGFDTAHYMDTFTNWPRKRVEQEANRLLKQLI